MHKLVLQIVTEPGSLPRLHPIEQLPAHIGRYRENEVRIKDTFVSGNHARLESEGDQVFVVDHLGSRNGVYVRDAQGKLTRLDVGARWALAQSNNEFYLGTSIRLRLMQPTADVYADSAALFPASQVSLNGTVAPLAVPPLSALPLPEGELNLLDLSLPALPAGGSRSPAQNAAPALPFEPVAPARAQYPAASLDTPAPDATKPLDSFALQGLQELVRAFVPERNLETPGDVARLIACLHTALEVLCTGCAELITSHLHALQELEISPSATLRQFGPPGLPPDPQKVAAAVLDFKSGGPEAARALAAAFTELSRHSTALPEGVRAGVQTLLQHLAPERRSGDTPRLGPWSERRAWADYRRRYEELARSDTAFRAVIAGDFARVFRETGNVTGDAESS
jgi:pSer/pThr/pTyr-binding forkhead associated (FHA) protein